MNILISFLPAQIIVILAQLVMVSNNNNRKAGALKRAYHPQWIAPWLYSSHNKHKILQSILLHKFIRAWLVEVMLHSIWNYVYFFPLALEFLHEHLRLYFG